ncbi:Hypothetical protein ABZS17H1_04582 (plasmid) [Kosakonia cowanii]
MRGCSSCAGKNRTPEKQKRIRNRPPSAPRPYRPGRRPCSDCRPQAGSGLRPNPFGFRAAARVRWRRLTAPPAATVPVAPRPPPRRCRCFKVATPFRRVGCAHSLSVVMPPPCRHSRGGLAVAPPGRHPGGEMHSAKTFCEGPQKLLSPPPSFLPRRRSFALCRESTSQGDGLTITTGENQNAHTKRQRQDRRRRNRRKM